MSLLQKQLQEQTDKYDDVDLLVPFFDLCEERFEKLCCYLEKEVEKPIERKTFLVKNLQNIKKLIDETSTYERYQQLFDPFDFKSITKGDFHKDSAKTRIEDFSVFAEIGYGKFGKVYLASPKKDPTFVCTIKQINFKKDKKYAHIIYTMNEIKSLHALRSEYVISLFDFFYQDESAYIVTECGYDGDLYDYLKDQEQKCFPEEKAIEILYKMIKAVKHCHDNGVIHRDIKLENFVRQGDKIKLLDFGWSTEFTKGELFETLAGTLDYLSTELITGRRYTEKVDIWCLGVMLYELIEGKTPFENEDMITTKLNIKYICYSFTDKFSENVRKFIDDVLVEEEERPTIEELLEYEIFTKFS